MAACRRECTLAGGGDWATAPWNSPRAPGAHIRCTTAAPPADEVTARAELRALSTPEHPAVTLRLDGTDHDVVLRAEGTHNAQNAAGAAALALTTGLTGDQVAAGLADVEPAFGRGQAFDIRGRHVVLHLVKNPAGFRQSLRALDHADPAVVVVAINDADADGRDVSWLWDVDFEPDWTNSVKWLRLCHEDRVGAYTPGDNHDRFQLSLAGLFNGVTAMRGETWTTVEKGLPGFRDMLAAHDWRWRLEKETDVKEEEDEEVEGVR